jgi:hypothetical protein
MINKQVKFYIADHLFDEFTQAHIKTNKKRLCLVISMLALAPMSPLEH